MTNPADHPIFQPKTYDEWNAIGYSPRKGQKATGRNAQGVCTFTLEQVSRKPSINDVFQSVMNRNIRELRRDMDHD